MECLRNLSAAILSDVRIRLKNKAGLLVVRPALSEDYIPQKKQPLKETTSASSAPFDLFPQLPVLLAILDLLVCFTDATPLPYASQLSPLSTKFPPKTEPLYDNTSQALTNHPQKRTHIIKATFYLGLWTLVLTRTTVLAQGLSSFIVVSTSATSIESFAQQIRSKITTRIAMNAAGNPLLVGPLTAVVS